MVFRCVTLGLLVFVILATVTNAECQKTISSTCAAHSLGLSESCADVGQCEGEFPEVPDCPSQYNETRVATAPGGGSPAITVTDPAFGSESGNDDYEYTGSEVVCGEQRDCDPDCDLNTDDCAALESATWIWHIKYTNPVAVGIPCTGGD
jgi:hypothetical protein